VRILRHIHVAGRYAIAEQVANVDFDYVRVRRRHNQGLAAQHRVPPASFTVQGFVAIIAGASRCRKQVDGKTS
jgi:hypothetical protein